MVRMPIGLTMSISLPTNKDEKRARLIMLVKQGSITQDTADKLYVDYCRLYAKVNERLAVQVIWANICPKAKI